LSRISQYDIEHLEDLARPKAATAGRRQDAGNACTIGNYIVDSIVVVKRRRRALNRLPLRALLCPLVLIKDFAPLVATTKASTTGRW
jgi:hypothetical protein